MKTNLSHEEIASLCLELSLLLHAGVGLGDGLALLAEESDRRGRELLEAMARQVDEGSSLSAAMKETGRFPAYVCGLIEVGETAGRTEEAGWINSAIYFDGAAWHHMDPTFASNGGGSGAIMKYIGNGSNYKVRWAF